MKIEKMKVDLIKSNEKNPRLIKDEKYHQLVNSIKKFPKMLEIRPIVVNKDGIILGGNMRLKACKEAGLEFIPVVIADELTEEEQKQFIIKDNIGYGEWDWELLNLEWNIDELKDWGLDFPMYYNETDIRDFFNETDTEVDETLVNEKIILEYPTEECILVKKELLKHGTTYEDAIYKLLGL